MNGYFALLSEQLPLRHYGYQVMRHRAPELFPSLKREFETVIATRLREFGCRDTEEFRAEDYHTFIVRNGIDHHAFIKQMRRDLPSSLFEHPYLQTLIAQAGELVGRRLRPFREKLEFRVVRPLQDDNNPWHRDHWFPYFDPLCNVYLPIASSFVDSAMQVVPFSHLWAEEECTPTFQFGEGQKTNKGGVLYSVPEIASCVHELKGHRPDIIPGDFMLFSPRCAHGAGSNSSRHTRFSLEFRLELEP